MSSSTVTSDRPTCRTLPASWTCCVCGGEAEVEPCLTPMLREQLQGIEERIARLEGSRESLTQLLAPLA
ncbi:hypothetical protein ABZY09_06040 [Streptomyces sp. NPDC002928]|uniref:hypothetical protein n=1 Tax=Streptomyces sp. NPDC002928 TaxID=3154440 RepID=UPI0033B8EE23